MNNRKAANSIVMKRENEHYESEYSRILLTECMFAGRTRCAQKPVEMRDHVIMFCEFGHLALFFPPDVTNHQPHQHYQHQHQHHRPVIYTLLPLFYASIAAMGLSPQM